jgi:Phospholipase_D-nuclease N-terminal
MNPLPLAYEFGTVIVWLAVLLWLVLWVVGVVDVIRRHDLGVGGKLLWIVVLLVLPFIGLFVYFGFSSRSAA